MGVQETDAGPGAFGLQQPDAERLRRQPFELRRGQRQTLRAVCGAGVEKFAELVVFKLFEMQEVGYRKRMHGVRLLQFTLFRRKPSRRTRLRSVSAAGRISPRFVPAFSTSQTGDSRKA